MATPHFIPTQQSICSNKTVREDQPPKFFSYKALTIFIHVQNIMVITDTAFKYMKSVIS